MAYPLKTWDGTQWVQVSSASTDLSIYYTQAAADAKILTGYRYLTTLYYATEGTFSFTKSSYLGLRAVRVKCQGAGGGSGGVGASGASERGGGGGGAGGNYVETFITDVSGMASSVTVTVGAGGAGGSAGVNNGSTGGTSSFGSYASATGGGGGGGSTPYPFWIPTSGGNISGSSVGDLIVLGEQGGDSNPVDTNGGYSGKGGSSQLSPGTKPIVSWQGGGTGGAGIIYGGGAAGGASGQSQAAKAGAAGAKGIVIVELYV
jgi:hypothetical protein